MSCAASASARVTRALGAGVLATLSHLLPTPALPRVETWSVKSTAMAAQTLLLACAAEGLSSAPIEGFDPRRVEEVSSFLMAGGSRVICFCCLYSRC